jgi:hypothetical protein
LPASSSARNRGDATLADPPGQERTVDGEHESQFYKRLHTMRGIDDSELFAGLQAEVVTLDRDLG